MSAARPASAQTAAVSQGGPVTEEGTAVSAGPSPGPGSGSPGQPGPAGLAITTSGLTKRFRGGQLAVDDLALAVPGGAVYGFLGPNGSGKTTTIRMLLGLIHPTRGSVCLLGDAAPGAAARVLPRVGSLVEGPAFYPYLSGRANLARIDAAVRGSARRWTGWACSTRPGSATARTRWA